MALTSLPDSTPPMNVEGPKDKIRVGENETTEYEFSLWHTLGSARSVGELKTIIKSIQTPPFLFDPDAFDQQFTLRVTDRVIVIKEMRRIETRGTLREIRGYIEHLDEYFYYNGVITEVYPLNHFISPEFYRAIENFVGSLVHDHEAHLIKEGKKRRKALFLELM